MKLRAWCQTDVGLRRESNQDFVLFDEDLGLYLLADGMGGHRGGEVASRMAVETVHASIRRDLRDGGNRKFNPRMALVKAYEEASRRIYDSSHGPDSADLHGMGTTLVVALVHQGQIFIANVGDSRGYLFFEGKLWQITEDHSLLNEQLRAGLVSDRDAANFAGKNVITRSVGFEKAVDVDVIERDLRPGELYLFCSDGLSGLVTDERICEILQQSQHAEIVSVCVNEAKKNGGDDNVSVLTVYAEPQVN